jgi:hypothetical protein
MLFLLVLLELGALRIPRKDRGWLSDLVDLTSEGKFEIGLTNGFLRFL